jgi:hypothetical protein
MNRTPEMQRFVDTMANMVFGKTESGCCVNCKQPFSDKNTFTPAGWRETKISGFCEHCWDEMFRD